MDKDLKKFANSSNRLLTKGLFIEHWIPSDGPFDKQIYTLRRRDVTRTDTEGNTRTFLSLYRLYMEEGDPTEHRFAEKYFYDFRHWDEMVSRSVKVKEELSKWREELEIKIKAEMYNVLRDDALNEESKTSTSSAKYLLDKFDKKIVADGKGLVSPRKREKIKSEALRLKQDTEQVDLDYERITGKSSSTH